jgi:membrane protease subunit (stomatin/prohibitin family)
MPCAMRHRIPVAGQETGVGLGAGFALGNAMAGAMSDAMKQSGHGSAQPQAAPQAAGVPCPECGHPNDAGAKFCTECGAKQGKPRVQTVKRN